MTKNNFEKRLLEAEDQIQYELAKSGFTPRRSTVQTFASPESNIVIHLEYRDLVVNLQDFDAILAGDSTFGKDVCQIVAEWYPRSMYKTSKDLGRLNKAWHEEKDLKKKTAIAEQRSGIEKMLCSKEAAASELAYAFGETGERLEQLYKIICGRFATEAIEMGAITARVPLRYFTEDMRNAGYADTKGFFEDMQKAYEFIRGLHGVPVVGARSGHFYEDISAFANGSDIIFVDDKPVQLFAWVSRDGIRHAGTNSEVRAYPLGMTPQEFVTALAIHYPELGTCGDDENVIFEADNSRLAGIYAGGMLDIISPPNSLKEFAPPFIERVLRYKGSQ